MGKLIDNIFDKLKGIVGAGDELIESKPAAPKPPIETSAEVSNRPAGPPKLVKDVDYYMEGRYMVLTAEYLQKRGYCCESGCRHCPYGFKRGDSQSRSKKEDKNPD